MEPCRSFIFLSKVEFGQSERRQPVLGGGVEEFWGAAIAGSGGDSPVFIKDIQDGTLIAIEVFSALVIVLVAFFLAFSAFWKKYLALFL